MPGRSTGPSSTCSFWTGGSCEQGAPAKGTRCPLHSGTWPQSPVGLACSPLSLRPSTPPHGTLPSTVHSSGGKRLQGSWEEERERSRGEWSNAGTRESPGKSNKLFSPRSQLSFVQSEILSKTKRQTMTAALQDFHSLSPRSHRAPLRRRPNGSSWWPHSTPANE